jgi:RNase H-fold protein (predicted Holliday junction resolvase)
MTTEQAEQAMIDGGRGRQDRRQRVDAVAAAMILQGYLDWASAGKLSSTEGTET